MFNNVFAVSDKKIATYKSEIKYFICRYTRTNVRRQNWCENSYAFQIFTLIIKFKN